MPLAAQDLPELTDRTAQSLRGLNNDVSVKILESADFNGDGFEDIVIARWDTDPVLLINDAGVLSNSTEAFIIDPSMAANSNYVEAFDANADGLADLVFARLNRSPWLLINRGNNSQGEWLGFVEGRSLDIAGSSLVIESGDVTGDGAPDLLVIEVEFNTNKLLVNDGVGNFSNQSEKLGELANLQRGHSALLDDTDADGDIDIVYIESDLFLYVYYNDGDGNFNNQQRQTFQNSDGFAYIFGAADFNGDGRFDFRQYSNTAPMAAMSTELNTTTGLPVFLLRQDAPMTRGNRKHGTTHMRDIDGDGDIDYVLSSMMRNFGGLNNTFEGMRTELVINAGVNSGLFIPFTGEDWGRDESMDARILDVNGDGNMDLFVAHQRRYGVYLNNAPSKIVELEALQAAPAESGTAVAVSAQLLTGTDVTYEWDFGDGELVTTTSASNTHVYDTPGRYLISVTARNALGSDQATITHRVHEPLVDGKSQSSTSVIIVGANAWIVNPDHNTVSVLNIENGQRLAEIPVGIGPRNLIAVGENVWVTNKDSSSVSVVSMNGLSVIDELPFKAGSQPHGVVSNEAVVYVVLEGTGELVKLDAASRSKIARVDVGRHPRHIAINASGSQLYVSRFISLPVSGESSRQVGTDGGGVLTVVRANNLAIASRIVLPYNNVEDTDTSARGIPNYLMAPALSPNGRHAYIAAKLDNIYRGSMRDGNAREHNMLVRGLMSTVDLSASAEILDNRIDFDNNSPPTAIAVGPTGNYLFIIHEASRQLEIFDVYGSEIIFSTDVGFAPQGLAISDDGTKLIVDNMLSRSVSVFDLTELMSGLSDNAILVRTIDTVSNEVLSPQVLQGKRLFHDAADAALTGQKYISCAVCHSEGGHDGRTWDFSDAGEGLRNTIDLRGRAGMGHGNIHWTANFDEIHDFENDIREIFDGTGLLTDEDYIRTSGILDASNPKEGLNDRLDALAAFVSSLNTFADSPYRESANRRSDAAERGHKVFRRANCAKCHSGEEFTDSPQQQFHNIGTVDADTGRRLGQALVSNGIDTPTLRGLWHGAPYLHDGSAADLTTAVKAHRSSQVGFNVNSLSSMELSDLVAYLLQIDRSEPLATSDNDNDGDGQINSLDNDDDNDSVADAIDSFPLDPTESADNDKDNIGDNQDADDDNDGVPDSVEDSYALDIDGDGIINRFDLDSDGDGITDVEEAAGIDQSLDGLIDNVALRGSLTAPPDTDADSLPDLYDLESTNPQNNLAGPFDIANGRWQSLDTNANGRLDPQDNGYIDSNNDGADDRTIFKSLKVGGSGGCVISKSPGSKHDPAFSIILLLIFANLYRRRVA